MALPLTTDNIEAIPETHRGVYIKQDDGTYRADFEVEDTGGLKSALESERTARKQLEKDVKAWKALGKSPAEIAELTAAAEAAATDAARKAGDFDGILKQHQTKWDGERTTLQSERDGALNVARSAVVDSNLKSALASAKATAEGFAALPKLLGDRVKTDFVNGEFTTTIMQADGKTPMIGGGANGTATFDDLVKDAIKNFPSLFEGSGAGGGGKPPKDAGGSGKTITRTEFEALSHTDKRAKLAAGVKVVD